VAYGEIFEYHADDRGQGQDVPTQAVGCICPPTSERTCQNPLCPRQPPIQDLSERILWIAPQGTAPGFYYVQ
jgi:hypothetical protein